MTRGSLRLKLSLLIFCNDLDKFGIKEVLSEALNAVDVYTNQQLIKELQCFKSKKIFVDGYDMDISIIEYDKIINRIKELNNKQL